jgi:hypothetical protein
MFLFFLEEESVKLIKVSFVLLKAKSDIIFPLSWKELKNGNSG